jgi:hypothetical protein
VISAREEGENDDFNQEVLETGKCIERDRMRILKVERDRR